MLNAYNAPPVYYPIDPATGNYQFITLVSVANPRAQLDLFRSQVREERLLNNVYGEYKFLKDFTLRVSYSTDNKNGSQYIYTPISTYIPNPKNKTEAIPIVFMKRGLLALYPVKISVFINI